MVLDADHLAQADVRAHQLRYRVHGILRRAGVHLPWHQVVHRAEDRGDRQCRGEGARAFHAGLDPNWLDARHHRSHRLVRAPAGVALMVAVPTAGGKFEKSKSTADLFNLTQIS